ncbi:hypothetical protein ID866_4975 [Astraeus odoratus]|nr:hypothetical protein ID866_4975 [Astraeus odoratus]
MRSFQLAFILLWVTWASAQLETVLDLAGDTVVELLTTNVAGLEVTSVLTTLLASSTTNPLANPITQTSTTTTSTPVGGGGVVEQTQSEPLTPGGPTPYTYTTTNAAGETIAVVATFTPTGPQTILPTPTTTGTVLDYSSWLGMIGTNTVAANAAGQAWLPIATGWYCLVVMVLTSLKQPADFTQFRLAVITYGAANTRPSPLLSKRFFGPPAHVTKELREEPAKLGIGQISCGDRGLSALEGLVAAIEVRPGSMDKLRLTYNGFSSSIS